MILLNNEQTVEDFLKACNFLAPKGMELKYFIVPKESNYQVPQGTGFQLEGISKDLSKTYSQKDPQLKHSFADSPNDSGICPPSLTAHEGAVAPIVQQAIQGTMIKSPATGLQIIENTSKEKSVMLKEDWCGFPRNTLFHFGRI